MLALDLLLDELRAASGAAFIGIARHDAGMLSQSGPLAVETDPQVLGALVSTLLGVAGELYHRVDLGRQVTLRLSGSCSTLWMNASATGTACSPRRIRVRRTFSAARWSRGSPRCTSCSGLLRKRTWRWPGLAPPEITARAFSEKR